MLSIVLIISILSCLVGVVMIFAYITTKNTIINLVMSFETQNSNSYEIRMETFSRSLAFLASLNSRTIPDDKKKKDLGEIFEKLMIVAGRKETLSVFEKVVNSYYQGGIVDEKLLVKYNSCIRKEFGGDGYKSKVVYKYVNEPEVNIPTMPTIPVQPVSSTSQPSTPPQFSNSGMKFNKPVEERKTVTEKVEVPENKNPLRNTIVPTGVSLNKSDFKPDEE